MKDLRAYREKRDPGRTPEPFGERDGIVRAPAGPWRTYVVQQHAARRMHWDLRLEANGTLASWSVPRGPSYDPAEKRLAVRTEDHPLEYAAFEGVIPAGNYGAGAMIVWDRGRYRTVDGQTPEGGIDSGKLDLLFDGHKLTGRFALVRTNRSEGRDWLLFHKPSGKREVLEPAEAWPESVFSGLTVSELRDGVSHEGALADEARRAGAPERALDPKTTKPMLATPGEELPRRDGWIYEVKLDGVRVLAWRRGDEVRLFSRAGRDTTGIYPEIAEAMAHLPVSDFVLDGEIVALDEKGRSSFERLQKRFTLQDADAAEHARNEVPVVCYAFDLLAVAGRDVRALPLTTRKRLLSRFVPPRGPIRFGDHVEGDGALLYEAVTSHGLEGVVAKRADSKYETGRRSASWVKVKVPRKAHFVIVGALAGKGSRRALGSLMVAWLRDGELVYAGNVGSGLDEATISRLTAELPARRISRPAFTNDPGLRDSFWVEPALVCEVRYTEVTEAGLLRHPVFLGLHDGIDPTTCVAPAEASGVAESEAEAESAPAARRGSETGTSTEPRTKKAEPALEITRPDKVFWPAEGYTKRDLLDYYEAAWPWLERYLRDRPVVLTRYPDGIEGKSFYQKNAPGFTPDWARRVEIEETDYFVCNDLRTLLYVINSGAIPLHVWSARLDSLDRPDWLILDLDPKGAPFAHVVEVARHTHDVLRELGAEPFVKTSGQDGLHVLLPLGARIDHRDAKALAEILAHVVSADLAEIATIARPVAQRGGKVYVDFLQNGRGKLIAAPFSVRPRAGAPISMPLRWSRVNARLDPARFTMKTALKRIAADGDPLAPILEKETPVEELLGALAARLASDGERRRS